MRGRECTDRSTSSCWSGTWTSRCWRHSAAQLAPGGCLVVEEHLATGRDDVAGPRNPAFRVPSGALHRAAGRLDVIESFEGEVADPDGRPAVVARLFARRPERDARAER